MPSAAQASQADRIAKSAKEQNSTELLLGFASEGIQLAQSKGVESAAAIGQQTVPFGIADFMQIAIKDSQRSHERMTTKMATKVHVIFYSMYGHIYRMAEAVAAGARELPAT